MKKLNDEWAEMKKQHEEDARIWKEQCEKLKTEGVPKKNWPKAPIRPRKPTLPAQLAEDDDDGPSDED